MALPSPASQGQHAGGVIQGSLDASLEVAGFTEQENREGKVGSSMQTAPVFEQLCSRDNDIKYTNLVLMACSEGGRGLSV